MADKQPFLRKGFVYFADAEYPNSIEMAKEYVKKMDFTWDDVKIVRRSNGTDRPQILVVGKRNGEMK
ncbi:MAG: hypothetical protein ACUZ8E_17730 [Candidatus Anammoxibacter sp.]